MTSAAKDLLAVVMSRAAGQALLLVSTLLVTPFFSPKEFGLVGVFTSTVAILCQLTSGRAEAVALAASSAKATQHFIGLAYLFNISAVVILFVLAVPLAVFMGDIQMGIIILLFPIAVLMMSINQYVLPAQITVMGHNRLAGRQIGISAATTATLQLIAAYTAPVAVSLVGARVVGPVTGGLSAWRFVRMGLKDAGAVYRNWSFYRLRPVWREFLLSSPSAILTVLAFQIPVYVFGLFGRIDEIGLFWLGFNLLLTPYMVISASFRPMFLRKVTAELHSATLPKLMWKACCLCGLAGGGLALAVSAVAWVIISQFMPESWLLAREFTVSLAIMVIGLSLALPFNAAVPALRSQRPNFVMNVIQLLGRGVVFYTALRLGFAPSVALFAMAFTSLLISIAYAIYMMGFVRRRMALL